VTRACDAHRERPPGIEVRQGRTAIGEGVELPAVEQDPEVRSDDVELNGESAVNVIDEGIVDWSPRDRRRGRERARR